MLDGWLTSQAMAKLAGIADRNARKALAKIHKGETSHWRGAELKVRLRHGQGGRSGIQYEVAVESLPYPLQIAFKEQLKADEMVREVKTDTKSVACAQSRFDLIQRVLQFPTHSPERADAVREIAKHKVLTRAGKLVVASESSVREWVGNYEKDGFSGLIPTKRRGGNYTTITRRWDDAVEGIISEADQYKCLEVIRDEIRALYAAGYSIKPIRNMVSLKLQAWTTAHGYRPNEAGRLESVCALTDTFIRKQSQYAKIARRKKDRKRDDDDKPRIQRTRHGMEPMQVLSLDVHHMDLWVETSDGKLKTPYLLAFMDVATGRVFCELVFCENRGSVRNVDLVTAMVNLLQHPSWGVPKIIYCDNGKEYGFADDLADLVKLGVQVRGKDKGGIKRALPYNAAAKLVELFFSHIEQMVAIAPSHIGGNRMDQKRPALGKSHKGFPGGFEAFKPWFFSVLKSYEMMPQAGGLKGKSPNLVFQEWVDRGWQATVVNPADILTVFTKPVQRAVKQHAFQMNGREWTCDELLTYFGNHIICRNPKWHGYNELRIEDMNGRFLGIARPDYEFEYMDPRGAQESARRQKVRNQGLTELAKGLPKADHTNIVEFADHFERAKPNPPAGVVTINQEGESAELITPSSEHMPDNPASREGSNKLARLKEMASEIVDERCDPK